MSDAKTISKALLAFATKEKAEFLPRFFKTGKGEYGEGDRFHGVVVPDQRKVANKFSSTTSKEVIIELLHSPFHEERLTGVFILCNKFNEAKKIGKEKEWYALYLKMAERINNWDLVDASAHIIVGQYLEDKDRSILYKLAKENSLWKNRIAVVATWHFIRKNSDLKDILQLSEIMLTHKHDLMHKATGWMLREGWKKDAKQIEKFLDKFATQMPRTMLRYAIEKMEETKRKGYLNLR
ncbi:MAG: DNA alkylation repair protein [Chitinophagaceae bacterium]|jgi:3-methyladenine DNA glycosylase AlkD